VIPFCHSKHPDLYVCLINQPLRFGRFYGEMQIPMGKSIEDTQKKEWEKNLPPTVKTLRSRWKEGMNFGEFSNATFAVFY